MLTEVLKRGWFMFPDDGAGGAGGKGDEKPEDEKPEDEKPEDEKPDDEKLPDDPKELKDIVQRMRKALSIANNQAAERRVKLKELDRLKGEEDKRRKAEMTEAELMKTELGESQAASKKLTDENAGLKDKLRDQAVRHAVEIAAVQLGMLTPADAVLFVKSEVKFDEDEGEVDPDSVKKALEKLKKDKPYLFGEAKTTTGGRGTPRGAGQGARRDQSKEEPPPTPGLRF